MQILYSTDEKLMRVNRLLRFDKYIKAKRLLEEILEEQPDHAVAHVHMAEIYAHQLTDTEMSEYHYRLAIKFDPQLVTAWYGYQQLLLYKSEHAALVQLAEEALYIKNIYRPAIYKTLGMSCEEQQKFRKAIKYFEKALSYSVYEFECDHIKKSIERNQQKLNKKKGKSSAEKKKEAVK